jgi:hypothetical protein
MGPQRQRRRGGDDGLAVVGVAVCVMVVVGALTLVVRLVGSVSTLPGPSPALEVGAAALAAASLGVAAAVITDRRARRALTSPPAVE